MFLSKKIVLVVFVLQLCRFSVAQSVKDTTSVEWRSGYLDIHHINTGRGVCSFFIFPDGTTMMVDAGDMDDSSWSRNLPLTITKPYPNKSRTPGQWIVNYIKQTLPGKRTISIDYALITHFHADHMGMITAKTKTSKKGNYKLTGITEVGDLIPIKKLIDRNYPDYKYPVDLKKANKKEPNIFLNLLRFIGYQQANGLSAESLVAGSKDQIVLNYQRDRYPEFLVRGVKVNGTIWTGHGDETFDYFPPDSVIDAAGKFNENPLSLAIKLSYGKFDYFTGGDNTGMQGYGLPAWFDVETPMAKAVGKVEVTTLDHHGNRDGTNENFLRALQPKAVIQQSWCSDHPGQEVMHRLLSDHLYKGEKNVFATHIQDVTKATLGFWLTRGYKSMFGHVITRVLPGGDKFYILIAETIKEKIVIKKVFGPYLSE